MAPLAFILSSLALTVTFSLSTSLGPPPESSLTTTPRSSPAGLGSIGGSLEEVQVNLVVNQLAIIRLLKQSTTEPVVRDDDCEGGSEREVLEEVRKMQNNMATMHGEVVAALRQITASQHQHLDTSTALNCRGTESEEDEQEIERLKEIVTALNSSITAQRTESEEDEQEIERLKEIVTALNSNITAQRTEKEEDEQEIEWLKDIVTALNSSITAQGSGCSVEGSLHVNDDCSISVCQRENLLPYQGSLAPNVSFSDLLAKGCIHLERSHKTWDAARANCKSLGGDLLVAGDLKGARQYVEEQIGSGYWPWVGMNSRKWLDGRPIADVEWNTGHPTYGADACGYAYEHGMRDLPCGRALPFLCQKGISY